MVSFRSGVEGSELGTATVWSSREIEFLLKKTRDYSLRDVAESR